jgi:hypothetical protein
MIDYNIGVSDATVYQIKKVESVILSENKQPENNYPVNQ